MHGNRETSGASAPETAADRREKAQCHTACTHAAEESDRGEVPKSRSNNEAQAEAEGEEGRPRIKENASPTHTSPAQNGERVSQGLAGVRQAARHRKKEKFTTLLHHLTEALLGDSFYRLKREAATGVDGVTWKEYETGLAERLRDLHGRVHRGAYRAQPSRRIYLKKADGRQRPIGVAALEDKIVQGAVVKILNQIYEEDFLGFSHGFRPGRSQHDGLDAVTVGIERKRVNWVLVSFDTISHELLLELVERRVGDVRVVRLIRAWLKAGVLEEGRVTRPDRGSPQGGVVSPLLSNAILHEVDRQWCRGDGTMSHSVVLVRYADDMVLLARTELEAKQAWECLQSQFAALRLVINQEKSRLTTVEEGFAFLGFEFRKPPRRMLYMWPRKKACQNIRDRVREVVRSFPSSATIGEVIRKLHPILNGWCTYFRVGNSNRVFHQIDWAVQSELQLWLRRKHQCSWRSARKHWNYQFLYKRCRLYRMVGRVSHLPGLRRTPPAEDGRRAGCGKSARPVR